MGCVGIGGQSRVISWRVYCGEFIVESWIRALRYGRRASVQF